MTKVKAAHFEQADGHHAQVGLHTLAVSQAGGFQRLVHGGLFVRDKAHVAVSRSESVQVSLKAAPAALLPTGAA